MVEYFNQLFSITFSQYQIMCTTAKIEGEGVLPMERPLSLAQYFRSKYQSSTKFQKWSEQEHQVYLKFLKENKDAFCDQHTRRSLRIFKKLSDMLDDRDPSQCRTHHKKLLQGLGFKIDGYDIDSFIAKAEATNNAKKQAAVVKRKKLDAKLQRKQARKSKKQIKQQAKKIRSPKQTSSQFPTQIQLSNLKQTDNQEFLCISIDIDINQLEIW